MRYNFTPFTYYKIISHEIIHAMGFEHVLWTNNTVMTKSIKTSFIQIFSPADIKMINYY